MYVGRGAWEGTAGAALSMADPAFMNLGEISMEQQTYDAAVDRRFPEAQVWLEKAQQMSPVAVKDGWIKRHRQACKTDLQ